MDIDIIASVLGLIAGIIVVSTFAFPLYKSVVFFVVRIRYKSLKTKNPSMPEEAVLVNILKSRPMFKKLVPEEGMYILHKETIKNVEELAAYIIKCESYPIKSILLLLIRNRKIVGAIFRDNELAK